MIGWIIFVIYMELYSVGIALAAKRANLKNPWLSLIPFVAFFYTDKLTCGFKILSIKVKSFGKLVIELTLITLAAYLYGLWGMNNLKEESIAPLIQIMWVPSAFSILIFYLGTVSSSLKILFNFRSNFKCDWLVCALLVPIPFLIGLSKNKYVSDLVY